MKNTSNKQRCPLCKGIGQPVNNEGVMFKCKKCGGFFDSEPDEGGDWSNRNVGLRMEREERRREKK